MLRSLRPSHPAAHPIFASLWSRASAGGTSLADAARFTDLGRGPKIAEAMRGLPAENALIDGEAVAFRPDGQSDFGALRTKAGGAKASLVAFDLLGLAGVEGLVFSEAIEGEGARVFAHACKLDLEGIVAKRKGGLYRSGTSRSWLKCRNPEFVRT